MKRVCIVVFALFLCATLFTVPSLSQQMYDTATFSQGNGVSITFGAESLTDAEFALQVEDLDISQEYVNGELRTNVNIPGAEKLNPAGYPELPSVMRMILIPPESGAEVNILSCQQELISGVKPMISTGFNTETEMAMVNLNPEDFSAELFSDKSAVDENGFYPANLIETERPVIFRGYRILPVKINPVRWNVNTGELEVNHAVDFQLDFNSDVNRVNLVENPDRPRPSRYGYQILSNLVINPPLPSRDMVQDGGSILYVTAASQSFNAIVDELEPLMEWRRQMGWTVNLLRVQNNTDRNAVLNAIQEFYDQNDPPPEHVVIVGDADGNYTMACHIHANVGNPYETDHPYSCLDGDDILGDVGLGRFVCDSPSMLRAQVQKTIQYESAPYMSEDEEERNWYKRAAVASTDWRNGASANSLVMWAKDLMLRKGWDSVDQLICSPNNNQPNPTQFINRNFNNGISIYIHRGWERLNGYQHPQVNDDLRNGEMLPFVILATCNTGDFLEHAYNFWSYIERFLWHTNGGAIGAVGTGGATHTYYNNMIVGGTMSNLLNKGIHAQGWALISGKHQLYNCYFDRGDVLHGTTHEENWLTHTYIYNLMGDPAVENFTDIPQAISVSHPEELRLGESLYRVVVTSEENDDPVAGALVCLYQADSFQAKGWTDENGEVILTMDPNHVEEGDVSLVVSGHNLLTHVEALEINNAEDFLGAVETSVDDDGDGDSNGDGDGVANPGEVIELNAMIYNIGDNDVQGDISVNLTSLNDHAEVNEANVVFEGGLASGEFQNVHFLVTIGASAANGEKLKFAVLTTAGDDSWESSIEIPVEAPELRLVDYQWVEDPLEPGQMAAITFTVANMGAKASPELTASLVSYTNTVGVLNEDASFAAMQVEAEESMEGTLVLNAHPLHIPGGRADVALVVDAGDDYRQEIPFTLFVGEGEDDTPFGPDNYGYVCFDNVDTTWFAVPTYNWIEIDPDYGDIQGVNTELDDGAENEDASTVVDLPFVFTYYGQEFTQATICTNGWMAFGEHIGLANGSNRPIPNDLNPPASLMPFWDDLRTTNDGGVFYHFDADNHIFVIEWSRMSKQMTGQSPVETFEIILYDPEFYPSLDGNGDILFQYLEIEDHRAVANVYGDTPYSTVGIASPDVKTGLQYTYWGVLTPGAAPLEPGRAIRFTTLVDFNTAFVSGTVTDVADGEPMANVLIRTDYGFWALTDSSGYYEIPELLVDPEMLYTFTASKQFFNDSTITDVEVLADDVIEVNFGLLHPEFALDFDCVDARLEQENANDFSVPLVNTGNGRLEFSSKLLFVAGGNENPGRDAMWDSFLDFDVTNTVIDTTEDGEKIRIGNAKITGIVFVDTLFYVSGGGNTREDRNAVIYRFTRSGQFVDSLALPWIDNWGVRGMEYDGENIWAAYRDHVYRCDVNDFAIIDSFEVEPSYTRDIAYDPENEVLYLTSITDPVYAFDRAGNLLKEWEPAYQGEELRKYGLTWHPMRESSDKLFIHALRDGVTTLFSCDPDSETVTPIRSWEMEGIGMDVTESWNSSVYVLTRVVDDMLGVVGEDTLSGDYVQVLQMEPNTTWLSFGPEEGVLEAGEEATLHIRVESGLRPLDRYWITLRFDHNAAPGYYEIPISMTIVDESGVGDVVDMPLDFSLEQNFPNPFNPATTIAYNLDKAERVTLSVFDLHGRLISRLVNGQQLAGRHEIVFDGAGLSSGIYLYRLEAGDRKMFRKMALVK